MNFFPFSPLSLLSLGTSRVWWTRRRRRSVKRLATRRVGEDECPSFSLLPPSVTRAESRRVSLANTRWFARRLTRGSHPAFSLRGVPIRSGSKPQHGPLSDRTGPSIFFPFFTEVADPVV